MTTAATDTMVPALFQMVEMSRDGLALLDPDHRFVYASPAACVLLASSSDELVGRDFLHHFVEHERAAIAEALESDEPARWSSMHVFDGEEHVVEYEVKHHTSDGEIVSTLALRDRTNARKELAEQEEIRRQEEQLREREGQYRAIFEAATDGLGIITEEGIFVEANPAYCRMLGYDYDEIIGRPAISLQHPDYRHTIVQGMDEIRAGGNAEVRNVLMRKDGTPIHIDGRGAAFTFKGKPHFLGVARDVTQQVQAEEQLLEREAQYRSIFEATSDGIVINDSHGTIVEVSPAFCEMYGYTYDELIGRHLSDLIHPDYHHQSQKFVQTIETGRTAEGRELGLRKDGTPFHVEVRGTSFTYKGIPHRLGVVRDVTEQVQAEKQLREREEQYRSIFEVSSDGFAITDLDTGRVVDANPAMCRMHGFTYEEMVGMHPTEFIHPDYHEPFKRHWEMVKEGGSYRARAVELRKDGTPFHVEVEGTSFMFMGKPRRLAVLRDITERVQAYELLEQRVKERTSELSTLVEVSRHVSSTLELQPLLEVILDQIEGVVQYAGASISLLDGDASEIVAYRGPNPDATLVGMRVPLEDMDPAWETFQSGPLIIDDVRADTPDAIAYRRSEAKLVDASFAYVRSWMIVPLIVNERLVGILTLNGAEPNLYTPHHAELVLAIAQQAAIAIENAQLYQKSQEIATLEERQRLARELHDSVTQALYGIGLGARTARSLIEGHPDKAIEPLDYVVSLAHSGMAEMRALIFELRPESLEIEGLVAALEKQVAALTSRHDVPIETAMCSEPAASLPLKEALYRIAQEALHNTFKHARPTRVTLQLTTDDGHVELEVADNGAGFDSGGSFPGHLGLQSMRERATRLGGKLEIDSAVGAGTKVSVRIPLHSD